MRRSLIAAWLLVLGGGLLGPTAVMAAVPANDSYANPVSIGSLLYSTSFDLAEATDDPGTQACESTSRRRIWYSYTPAVDQTIRASIGGAPESGEIAVWRVTGTPGEPPELLRCSVEGRDLLQQLTAGTAYLISVGQWYLDAPFAGTLTVAVQLPLANDAFADAIGIESSPFETTVDGMAMFAGGVEVGEPIPSCTDPDVRPSSVWYRLSVADTTTVFVPWYSASPNLAIYEGTSLGELTEVACTWDGMISFGAEAGRTYYLQVWGATLGLGTLGVEFSTPPDNDDFADRMGLVVPGGDADLTIATTEAGEPTPSCAAGRTATAWWSYAAPADGILHLNHWSYGSFVAVYTGSTLDGLQEVACLWAGATVSLPMEQGDAIVIQAGADWAQPGPVGFSAAFAIAPPNDDIADATLVEGIPSSFDADLSAATAAADDPQPSCAWSTVRSVWYRMTAPPESFSISLSDGSHHVGLAAYTGTPGNLDEIGCRPYDGYPLTVRGNAGEALYIEVFAYDFAFTFTPTISLAYPGEPQAGFYMWPQDPAAGEEIFFWDNSSDPGASSVAGAQWDFGDGSSSTELNPRHAFAADGIYDVAYTITLSDGRTATTVQQVQVRTHDVGIQKLKVPTAARAGQTRSISVGIGNPRYAETVTVYLYVSRPFGYEFLGAQTVQVPVTAANQSFEVSFSYTFTMADATAGKVTFRVELGLETGRDAVPGDNQAISLATRVAR